MNDNNATPARRFEGKVAIVTGGNVGIGQAVCKALAREGARVVIGAGRVEEGEQTVEQIKQDGGEASFVATDITQANSVRNLVDQCIVRYGQLDVAFNNAGITGSIVDEIVDYDEDIFDQTIAVNLRRLRCSEPRTLRGFANRLMFSLPQANPLFPRIPLTARSQNRDFHPKPNGTEKMARKG